MPYRPLALLVLAPVAGAVLAACSSGGDLPVNTGASQPSAGRPAAVVLLQYDSVEPSRVTIHAGQSVKWLWEEAQFPSNVTFDTFASPTQDSGSWSHTFSNPGTYPYRDSLRLEATGVIIVQP